VTAGIKAAAALALHDTRTAGPLEGRDGVGADLWIIGVAEDIAILAYAYIIALILGVPPQNGGKLLTGDGVGRAVVSVVVAQNDAVLRAPGHGVDVILPLRHIGESGRRGACGLPSRRQRTVIIMPRLVSQ